MWEYLGVSVQQNINASRKAWDLNHNLLLKLSFLYHHGRRQQELLVPAAQYVLFLRRCFRKALLLVILFLITRKLTLGFTFWVRIDLESRDIP